MFFDGAESDLETGLSVQLGTTKVRKVYNISGKKKERRAARLDSITNYRTIRTLWRVVIKVSFRKQSFSVSVNRRRSRPMSDQNVTPGSILNVTL